MPIEVNGKTLETDEEGYLANINEWEPEVANVMAKADDLDLTDEHWEIIKFLREYYEEYQIAPAVRVLTKAVGKKQCSIGFTNKWTLISGGILGLLVPIANGMASGNWMWVAFQKGYQHILLVDLLW